MKVSPEIEQIRLELKLNQAETLRKVAEKQLAIEKANSELLIQMMNQQINVVYAIASIFTLLIIFAGSLGISRFKDIEVNAESDIKKFSEKLQEDLKKEAEEDSNEIHATLEKQRGDLSNKLIEDFRTLEEKLKNLEGKTDKNDKMVKETSRNLEVVKKSNTSDSIFEDYWKRKAKSEMTEENWLAYARESDPKNTIDVLQEGVKYCHDSIALNFELGTTLIDQNQFFSALQSLHISNILKPSDDNNLYYLSEAYNRTNNLKMAIQVTSKAHQIDSNNGWNLFQLIWGLLVISDWETAHKHLEFAMADYPEDVDFYTLYVDYSLNQKNFQDAEEYAKKIFDEGSSESKIFSLIKTYILMEKNRSLAEEVLAKIQPNKLNKSNQLNYSLYINLIAFLDGTKLSTSEIELNKDFAAQPHTYFAWSTYTIRNWANDLENDLTQKQRKGILKLIKIPLEHNQRIRDEDKARTDKKYGKGTWEKYCLAKSAEEPDWEELKEI